jgi:N-succinyldiaminopimelate aminotransferase
VPELRETIARLERRYGLASGSIRADVMVCCRSTAREGLFSFVQSTIDARRGTPARDAEPVLPDLRGRGAARRAQCRYLSCDEEHSYLPDLDAVPASDWDACQLLFLCSPGNPRARSCPNRTCAAHWSWPTATIS